MGENPLDTIEPRVLAARLREAREARGWTQQQLADRLKMARTTIVAIEKGERRLRPQELIELASLLGRSVSEFLQRGAPPEGFAVQLRETMPLPASLGSDLPQYIEEFQLLCEDYGRLEEMCQAPLRRRYPPEYEIQGTDPELAAEDVAATERSRLDLGEGPLVNLREVLEADVGLRIFQLVLPSKVAGMFAFTEPLGGCIAVNLHHPPERRRTSLAHEYGHFLTARYRPEITLEDRYERRPAGERFAEAFARALLMPASGLRRRYLETDRERSQGVTFGDLCRLAHFYAVSVEAMIRRLEELRLIPAGSWDRLRQEHFRVREAQKLLGLEPIHADNESLSPRYIALAIEAWQREQLSEGQLARFLRTDRVGARERIQRLELAAANGSDEGESIDLGAPLLRSAGR
ncbi:MAG TPA: XRE family transcriptional regulator [Thermoanaerobaculia bacterium]|jgi:Zn-dependent peptidase ImmA (M78 family)/DNA-binding XRE family transcriptional regulator